MKLALIKCFLSVAVLIISPILIAAAIFYVWKPKKIKVVEKEPEYLRPFFEQMEMIKRRENLQ